MPSCVETPSLLRRTAQKIQETPRWVKVTAALLGAAGITYCIRNYGRLGGAAAPRAHVAGPIPYAAIIHRAPSIITTAPSFAVVDRDKDTPLHQAARNNNEPLVRELLAQGHSPYALNLFKETPASIARVKGSHVIQALLARTAGEYEVNRAWFRTMVGVAFQHDGQHPNIGSLVGEYTCGPNEQAWNVYPS